MNTVTIPRDAESLLLYLLSSNMQGATSMPTLRREYPGQLRVEDALVWLVEYDLVCADNEGYELTFTGLHQARQIQAAMQAKQLASKSLAAAETKQLESGNQSQRKTPAQPAHPYLLAFETAPHQPPIPVRNGDVLGRAGDASIRRDDDFISSYHCRFYLEQRGSKFALFIEDLGSRNGTYINQFRLEKNRVYELEHGSRIRIGTMVLLVIEVPY